MLPPQDESQVKNNTAEVRRGEGLVELSRLMGCRVSGLVGDKLVGVFGRH